MIYDVIIIGAGAAGLFAGASVPVPVKGLILEKCQSPGKKLLMTGAGQCNLTHGGNIKEFLLHYGENGKNIRNILYHYNNQSVMDFFSMHNIPVAQREDGKIFPQSLQSKDILAMLVDSCQRNGFEFSYSSAVTDILIPQVDWEVSQNDKVETLEDSINCPIYTIKCGTKIYLTKKLIIATGGASYPSTGSDGNFSSIFKKLKIQITPMQPALVPIHVQGYPYSELSGISFSKISVSIHRNQGIMTDSVGTKKIAEKTDDLLLTHTCFSGPAILNISRFASTGDTIVINYFPKKSKEIILNELKKMIIGNSKQVLTLLHEYFNDDLPSSPSTIPKRFLEFLCKRLNLNPSQKSSQLSGANVKDLVHLITADTYFISGLGGYNLAMVTKGGVCLDAVDLKTLESKQYPNLFIIGEALDVDGDTGGYNLQFAFSSGHLVANQI